MARAGASPRAAGGRSFVLRPRSFRHVALGRVRLVILAFGWRGIVRRAWYVVRLRTRWFRLRTPVRDSFDGSAEIAWGFHIQPTELRARYRAAGIFHDARRSAEGDADRLLKGASTLYGGLVTTPGWPPQWTRHPLTGAAYPEVHWSVIDDDDASRGDIKDVWELSRFGCTFILARAFVLTGDSKYAEAWWTAVEDWAASNPPNVGVNWRCAQESSLRAMAWCFGRSVFADDPSSTPARLGLLGRMVGATVRRVRPTLGYALSQRNNHALSELAFLLSVPGRRDRRAQRLLGEVLSDQFFDDGSYTQQSLVYQRLAVHVLAWLVHVQRSLPTDLDRRIRQRLSSSAEFLDRCSDPVSRQLMNYGANDGSFLLAIGDLQPLNISSTLSMLGRHCGESLSNELSLWITVDVGCGSLGESTYRTLRGQRSCLLTRIGTIPRRSGDSDQQALELILDGTRVVLDPGTYRYTAVHPWRNPFIGADVHSMPSRHDEFGTTSVGRFLRAPMAPAHIVYRETGAGREMLVSERAEGEVRLCRTVIRVDDRYAVVDEAAGGSATLRWNLALMDLDDTSDVALTGRGPANVAIDRRGDYRVRTRLGDDPYSGWWSPTYGVLEPCVVVEVELVPGVPGLARFAPTGQELLTRGEIEILVKQLARSS